MLMVYDSVLDAEGGAEAAEARKEPQGDHSTALTRPMCGTRATYTRALRLYTLMREVSQPSATRGRLGWKLTDSTRSEDTESITDLKEKSDDVNTRVIQGLASFHYVYIPFLVVVQGLEWRLG